MKEMDQCIVKLADSGMTQTEIASRLGLTFARVTRVVNVNKYICRNATNKAIKDGLLIRPFACSECKKECKPHSHHPDYSKPLLVEWLCRQCHTKRHSKPKLIAEVWPTMSRAEILEGAASLGRKGGLAGTDAQRAARAVNLERARARRWPRKSSSRSPAKISA